MVGKAIDFSSPFENVERAVRDLADIGMDTSAIASKLDVAEALVAALIDADDSAEETEWRAAAVVASKRYVAAVAASGGAFR